MDALGDAPDIHCLPVGNAGNITAYWMGYTEYAASAWPRASRGCSASRPPAPRPIVNGAPVTHPQTIATAIRIGNPASWQLAEAARDESGGADRKVTDRQIPAAYKLLAHEEGVFVELASAASVAGLLAARPTAASRRLPGGLHDHRQRPQGPGLGHLRRPGADHGPGGLGRRRRGAPRPGLKPPADGSARG